MTNCFFAQNPIIFISIMLLVPFTRSHICGLWCYEKEVPGFASTEDILVAISLCKQMVEGKHHSVNNGVGRMKLIIPRTTKSSFLTSLLGPRT